MGGSFPNETKLVPGNPDLDTANVGQFIKSDVTPGREVDGALIRRPVIFYNISYGVNAFADPARHEAAYLFLQWAGGARAYTFLTFNLGGYQDPHHIYTMTDPNVAVATSRSRSASSRTSSRARHRRSRSRAAAPTATRSARRSRRCSRDSSRPSRRPRRSSSAGTRSRTSRASRSRSRRSRRYNTAVPDRGGHAGRAARRSRTCRRRGRVHPRGPVGGSRRQRLHEGRSREVWKHIRRSSRSGRRTSVCRTSAVATRSGWPGR